MDPGTRRPKFLLKTRKQAPKLALIFPLILPLQAHSSGDSALSPFIPVRAPTVKLAELQHPGLGSYYPGLRPNWEMVNSLKKKYLGPVLNALTSHPASPHHSGRLFCECLDDSSTPDIVRKILHEHQVSRKMLTGRFPADHGTSFSCC